MEPGRTFTASMLPACSRWNAWWPNAADLADVMANLPSQVTELAMTFWQDVPSADAVSSLRQLLACRPPRPLRIKVVD